MSNDDASPADYEPLEIVRSMHSLPHLNARLQRQSNDFDIDHDELFNSYTQSLLPLPIIVGALAVLVLLMYHIYLCARCCCCRHYSEPPTPAEVKRNKERCVSTRCKVLLLFVVCLLGTIICDQGVLVGNAALNKAVRKLDDGLDYLLDTFDSLVSAGDSLESDGDQLRELFTEAANSGCAGADNLDQYVDDYDQYVSDYQDQVDSFPGEIDDAKDSVNKYAVQYKNYFLWALYAAILVAAVFLSIGILAKYDCWIYFSISLSDLILMVLFVILTIEMIILMGLADYCMDPLENLVNSAPGSISDELEYYTTCQGTNPLIDDVEEAQTFIDEARAEVNALLDGPCAGNDALEESLGVFDSIDNTIDGVEDTASCEPTLREIESVLNNGLCNKTFTGIYWIWLGQYLAAAFLVLLLFVASFSFYRPPAERVFCDDEDQVELAPTAAAVIITDEIIMADTIDKHCGDYSPIAEPSAPPDVNEVDYAEDDNYYYTDGKDGQI